MDAEGRPVTCWKTTVLHDTALGWPGQCLGLFQMDTISTETLCKQACWGDPRCSTWQLVNSTKPMQCWIGQDAKACDLRNGLNKDNSFQMKRSQRLQHGNVHVFKSSLAGTFIHNLYNFGTYAEGSQALSIQRCRDTCYSALSCQYWLFSTKTGCWADAPAETTNAGKNPEKQVAYPLSASDVETGTEKAKAIIAGEFLVHYCPLAEVIKPAKDPFYHPKQKSDNTWLILLGSALLVLCAGGALFYYFMIYVPGRKGSRDSLIKGGRDRFDTDASMDEDYGHGPMKAPGLDESQMSQMSHYQSGTAGQDSFGPPAPPQPISNRAFPQPARPASPTAMRLQSQGYQPIQPSVQQMANMPTMLMPPGGQQASLSAPRQSVPPMAVSYRPQQQIPSYPGPGGGRLM